MPDSQQRPPLYDMTDEALAQQPDFDQHTPVVNEP